MKNIQTVCLFIYLLSGFAVKAQDTIATSGWYSFWESEATIGKYYFPVAQYISIYAEPDVRSKVLYKTKTYADTLQVKEVLQDKKSKFKNVYGKWFRVTFPFNGKRFIGYVPSQFLSTMCLREKDQVYLVSIISYENRGFTCALKILRNFQLIHEYKFSPVANYTQEETDTGTVTYAGYMDITLTDNRKLKNIDRILQIKSGYEACGYRNGSTYLWIRDNKVVKEMEDGGSSEAFIYSAYKSFIFPSDSLGEKNALLEQHENYENLNDSVVERELTIFKFKWDGEVLNQVDSTYKKWAEKFPLK